MFEREQKHFSHLMLYCQMLKKLLENNISTKLYVPYIADMDIDPHPDIANLTAALPEGHEIPKIMVESVVKRYIIV